ncbi:MAG: DUF4239 domain-containing protein [Chlamydiia bacterium]|nr:DUF4239 domain-containing protein [Chlamydiia bacterium]
MGLLESSSWVIAAAVVVIPAILFSLVILWIVRKWVSIKALRQHHDVAGFTLSIIGVLYSVVLGFTVINVQERYNKAEETIHTEAIMIADLYRDAGYFDLQSRNLIRANLRQYVRYVIDQEWALPSNEGRRLKADSFLQALWNSYGQIDLQSELVRIWYEQAIAKLDRLMNARLSREFNSSEQLNSMLWTVLIAGGVITVLFMFLFGLESLRMQMLMTALLTGYIAFMLYLVYSLDHIFAGPVHLTPKAFQETLVILDRLDERA